MVRTNTIQKASVLKPQLIINALIARNIYDLNGNASGQKLAFLNRCDTFWH